MKSRLLILISTIFFAACSVKTEWYLLESKELGFEISLPKQPKFVRQTSILETGKQDFDIYFCDSTTNSDDNLNYFIARTEYSDTLMKLFQSNPDRFFETSIQNSTESVHGKIISQKVINYKNYPGREVKIDFKNGEAVITMKIYLVRNEAFILQTITHSTKDNNSSQTKFFESFRLTE